MSELYQTRIVARRRPYGAYMHEHLDVRVWQAPWRLLGNESQIVLPCRDLQCRV